MFAVFVTSVIIGVKWVFHHKEKLMRVSKEKAAENRHDILTAAARLFREQGISATGVDAIPKEARLTHGAVYSQFGSKEAIAAEAVRLALRGSERLWQRLVERKGAKQAFPVIVATYLSRDHRDAPGRGCAVAALGSEIARQPQSVREAFTEEFKNGLAFLAKVIPGDGSSRKDEEAIAAFASMVGALILARAVNDEPLSDRILQVTAQRVTQSVRARTPAQRARRRC
jgi:TetR/AcrR family transcriptional repressor of nem operon